MQEESKVSTSIIESKTEDYLRILKVRLYDSFAQSVWQDPSLTKVSENQKIRFIEDKLTTNFEFFHTMGNLIMNLVQLQKSLVSTTGGNKSISDDQLNHSLEQTVKSTPVLQQQLSKGNSSSEDNPKNGKFDGIIPENEQKREQIKCNPENVQPAKRHHSASPIPKTNITPYNKLTDVYHDESQQQVQQQKVFIRLKPLNGSTHQYQLFHKNFPRLEVKVGINECVSYLLEYLNRKWLQKQEGENMGISLYPESEKWLVEFKGPEKAKLSEYLMINDVYSGFNYPSDCVISLLYDIVKDDSHSHSYLQHNYGYPNSEWDHPLTMQTMRSPQSHHELSLDDSSFRFFNYYDNMNLLLNEDEEDEDYEINEEEDEEEEDEDEDDEEEEEEDDIDELNCPDNDDDEEEDDEDEEEEEEEEENQLKEEEQQNQRKNNIQNQKQQHLYRQSEDFPHIIKDNTYKIFEKQIKFIFQINFNTERPFYLYFWLDYIFYQFFHSKFNKCFFFMHYFFYSTIYIQMGVHKQIILLKIMNSKCGNERNANDLRNSPEGGDGQIININKSNINRIERNRKSSDADYNETQGQSASKRNDQDQKFKNNCSQGDGQICTDIYNRDDENKSNLFQNRLGNGTKMTQNQFDMQEFSQIGDCFSCNMNPFQQEVEGSFKAGNGSGEQLSNGFNLSKQCQEGFEVNMSYSLSPMHQSSVPGDQQQNTIGNSMSQQKSNKSLMLVSPEQQREKRYSKLSEKINEKCKKNRLYIAQSPEDKVVSLLKPSNPYKKVEMFQKLRYLKNNHSIFDQNLEKEEVITTQSSKQNDSPFEKEPLLTKQIKKSELEGVEFHEQEKKNGQINEEISKETPIELNYIGSDHSEAKNMKNKSDSFSFNEQSQANTKMKDCLSLLPSKQHNFSNFSNFNMFNQDSSPYNPQASLNFSSMNNIFNPSSPYFLSTQNNYNSSHQNIFNHNYHAHIYPSYSRALPIYSLDRHQNFERPCNFDSNRLGNYSNFNLASNSRFSLQDNQRWTSNVFPTIQKHVISSTNSPQKEEQPTQAEQLHQTESLQKETLPNSTEKQTYLDPPPMQNSNSPTKNEGHQPIDPLKEACITILQNNDIPLETSSHRSNNPTNNPTNNPVLIRKLSVHKFNPSNSQNNLINPNNHNSNSNLSKNLQDVHNTITSILNGGSMSRPGQNSVFQSDSKGSIHSQNNNHSNNSEGLREQYKFLSFDNAFTKYYNENLSKQEKTDEISKFTSQQTNIPSTKRIDSSQAVSAIIQSEIAANNYKSDQPSGQENQDVQLSEKSMGNSRSKLLTTVSQSFQPTKSPNLLFLEDLVKQVAIKSMQNQVFSSQTPELIQQKSSYPIKNVSVVRKNNSNNKLDVSSSPMISLPQNKNNTETDKPMNSPLTSPNTQESPQILEVDPSTK